MSTQSLSTENEYMYSSASEEVEAKRLQGLNDIHNPHTLSYLKPYLRSGIKILELGCGSGYLAAEVMDLVDSSIYFVGVDRDIAQINNTQRLLKKHQKNSELLSLDLITELDKLKEKGPFDLIYCRWVLVHLPNEVRENVLRNVIKLLAKNGIFICEECDNRSVEFQPNGEKDPTAPYEQASELWSALSLTLMKMLKNDLEFTPDKISRLLSIASNGNNKNIKIEGQYQLTLKGFHQKRLITDGYRSSASILSKAYGKPIEPIIEIFDQCAKDDGLDAPFLTQNLVSYRQR